MSVNKFEFVTLAGARAKLSQVDLTAVSALARTAEPKVSVDLRDILTP